MTDPRRIKGGVRVSETLLKKQAIGGGGEAGRGSCRSFTPREAPRGQLDLAIREVLNNVLACASSTRSCRTQKELQRGGKGRRRENGMENYWRLGVLIP